MDAHSEFLKKIGEAREEFKLANLAMSEQMRTIDLSIMIRCAGRERLRTAIDRLAALPREYMYGLPPRKASIAW